MQLYNFECKPVMAWLTVNQACNMRCKWCYGEGSHYEPNNVMSLELACELVDIAIGAGAKHFNIIGGEPTLWQHIFNLIDYCRSKNVTSGLITNATLFSDDSFWAKYAQHPADRISISVKSTDPNEFANVTGSDLYKKTMKGISRAISLHKTGVSTVYNTLVGIDGLKQIAEKCKALGADSIIVNMCSPTIDKDGKAQNGYSIPLNRLSTDTIEIVEYLDMLYDGNAEVDIQMPLCLFPEEFVEKKLATRKIMTLCQIFNRSGINFSYNGDVTVCNEFAIEPIAKKGVDFTDGTSLLAHLNSQKVRDFYAQILRYPAECCTECRWKNDCRGGCLMNWLVYEPTICRAVLPKEEDSTR